MTVLIETAPHEFSANYLFNDRGLFPYFAADKRVKEGEGSQRASFTAEGEEWAVTLYFQESGLEHPGKTTPSGTRFELETLREFRLAISSKDDSVGQRKFNAHIAPRWVGMKSKGGSRVPVPEGFGEGVNVRVSGSNIEFKRYLPLLQCAAEAVGIDSTYFSGPHPYSNIQDAERYIRLNHEVSGPVHARDGPIVQMGHLLENDREGYRKLVQNDQTEDGKNLPGYYHTVTLDQRRIQEAFPSHELPKEIKHYYAREALSFPENNPLRHPKLGASYQVSRWKGKLGVSSEEIEQLTHELEESVLSVLANSGIDVRPGGDTYVKDAYFPAIESDRERQIIDLNLTRIRQSQESVVIKHIADGLSPVEWESLSVLVSDGGTVSPKRIAEETDRHPDSVRRALDRISELVEREYGSVSLRSHYVAELVHEAVTEAKRASERALEAGAKALEAAERGLDRRTSAFIAWAAKHDVRVNERDDSVFLDLGELSDEEHRKEVKRLLREGLSLWEDCKRDSVTYRSGRYRYRITEPEHELRSIEAEERTRTIGGRVWEALG
ncbi:MarR family transcriptional regulator [Salinigranum salinum]|uniref:MarR family transcriptional regulator n=1 Tax=Salinigranum salinum TaxID=1364937 RepID=UPI001F04EE7F|nr:MarR family transcriptional regulator [Salinigranum salinum]